MDGLNISSGLLGSARMGEAEDFSTRICRQSGSRNDRRGHHLHERYFSLISTITYLTQTPSSLISY